MSIPVIDLFAGPGGLGEGFSRQSSANFHIAVSIEKDGMAFETLRLRAAHRMLSARGSCVQLETWSRWDRTIAEEPWNIVFDRLRECGDADIAEACAAASREALHFELGHGNRSEVTELIRERLRPWSSKGRLPRNAVLIGGPPCQAYSIVGRSRNRGTEGYVAERDPRHFLYLEYLNVIAEFRPAVFVMENVKGILTSKVHERQIFQTILKDLRRPDLAAGTTEPVEYVLLPLPQVDSPLDEPAPDDFIVRAEEYGVPQARHRVIILGVRKDVYMKAGGAGKLQRAEPPTVWDVMCDLPALRPQLSHRGRGLTWLEAFSDPLFDAAVREMRETRSEIQLAVADRLMKVRADLRLRERDPGPGSDRSVARKRRPRQLANWYKDRDSILLLNHESRAHMPSDLVRYMFVAAFGEVVGSSPKLAEFPKCLLPEHKNVDPENIGESIFKDRFRVQVADRHSMTVTSHIAKDGHAFIHPKADQCRSLTVREAARLQTFPDSYVFLGNRTSQYTQVGNAVPPYLAKQIADVVAEVMERAGLLAREVGEAGRVAATAADPHPA